MSKLIMVVWDVQHGNAIYMRTPNGTNIMFDIGTGVYNNGKEFSPLRFLYKKISGFNLDWLVVSHPHVDHLGDAINLFKLRLFPMVFIRPFVNPLLILNKNRIRGIRDIWILELYFYLDHLYPAKFWYPMSVHLGDMIKFKIFRQFKYGLRGLNNYSIVSVVEFCGQKIILPGDIEQDGWKGLLEQPSFIKAIKDATIFVASHHGRKSGFYANIFKSFLPDIVIVSDGHSPDTSAVSRYNQFARGVWVIHRQTGRLEKRKVFTTRKDGHIVIEISCQGNLAIRIVHSNKNSLYSYSIDTAYIL